MEYYRTRHIMNDEKLKRQIQHNRNNKKVTLNKKYRRSHNYIKDFTKLQQNTSIFVQIATIFNENLHTASGEMVGTGGVEECMGRVGGRRENEW